MMNEGEILLERGILTGLMELRMVVATLESEMGERIVAMKDGSVEEMVDKTLGRANEGGHDVVTGNGHRGEAPPDMQTSIVGQNIRGGEEVKL